jgi:hypothetical protein
MSISTNSQQNSESTHLWFKAKLFGYGWTPSSWQGWSITLLYLFYFSIKIADLLKDSKATGEPIGEMFGVFFMDILIVTFFLILVCYLTGEKPRWRWGK